MNDLILALGTFDGLHRGHIAVLNEVKALAEGKYTAGALFFDCHPQKVLKGSSPPLLITADDKENALKEMGITPVFVSFSEIKDLSPENFVKLILKEKLSCKGVVTGENFRFGKNGEGNCKILCSLCEKYGIIYKKAPSVTYEGELISATRIRKALSEGKVKDANNMLGRFFSYDFLVVEGNKIGKKYFGFPTINQHFPADFINLRYGVYASRTLVDGVIYPSVTNFGCHPTIGGDLVLSETCILGFDGDLYNRKIKVELLDFVRGEKKFASKEELKEQIRKDSETAAEIFKRL